MACQERTPDRIEPARTEAEAAGPDIAAARTVAAGPGRIAAAPDTVAAELDHTPEAADTEAAELAHIPAVLALLAVLELLVVLVGSDQIRSLFISFI